MEAEVRNPRTGSVSWRLTFRRSPQHTARLDDLKGTETAHPFQDHHEPRKKLKKTSPELKAKQGAEIRDPRPNSRGWRLKFRRSSMSSVRSLRKHRQRSRRSWKEASPEIKARMKAEIERLRPRALMRSAKSLRRHRQ